MWLKKHHQKIIETPDVWTDFDILHNDKLKAEIQKQREKN